MGLLHAINEFMHKGSTCPQSGSLGECCGIWLDDSSATHALYQAAVYLWPAAEGMPFSEVARWFREAAGIGDDDVIVHLIAHDTSNETREGRCHDGVRPLSVEFVVPLDRAAKLGMELPREPRGPEPSTRLSIADLMDARSVAPHLSVEQIQEVADLPVDQLQLRLISALATRAVKTSLPAWLDYNHEREELVIHGKRYSAAMFAAGGLAGPAGLMLQLVDGPADTVTLRRWVISHLDEILREVDRATAKFPTWPDDVLHAIAILGEEFGELTKEAMQLTYEPHKTSPEELATEAIQTAAMALRFAMSLGRYRFVPSTQHGQV